jgi:superfamily I DNA/RNA helicase
VADFAVKVNKATDGAAMRRLEDIYDVLLVDEVQDLVGYDLDVLDFLLRGSAITVKMVGDPRQHTYATNQNNRNKKYRGAGLFDWLNERPTICELETRNVSRRCNQAICDFADALYPGLPTTRSSNEEVTRPTGIIMLSSAEVPAHVAACKPIVLRWDTRTDTLGLDAINFGVSKGSTHGHILIFPTGPMKVFLEDGDPSALADGARSKLYVGITRAKHSVAFVV